MKLTKKPGLILIVILLTACISESNTQSIEYTQMGDNKISINCIANISGMDGNFNNIFRGNIFECDGIIRINITNSSVYFKDNVIRSNILIDSVNESWIEGNIIGEYFILTESKELWIIDSKVIGFWIHNSHDVWIKKVDMEDMKLSADEMIITNRMILRHNREIRWNANNKTRLNAHRFK